MNRILIIIPVLLALLCNSCEFRQSINKDLKTGAYSRGDGLSCDGVVIEIDNNVEERSTFAFGEKVNLTFVNVEGLKVEKNMVYPKMSIYIIKNEQDTIDSDVSIIPVSLSELKDGEVLQLYYSFRANFPNKNQEKYKLIFNILDEKGEGAFFYELPFKIEENTLFDINSENIEYSGVYLFNKTKQKVVSKEEVLNRNNMIELVLKGFDGFNEKNGYVQPNFSIEVVDHKENKIFSIPNALSDAAYGVKSEDFKERLGVNIIFPVVELNNPYTLKAVLEDKDTSNKIVIETELNLK